jgi:hypothetical protein
MVENVSRHLRGPEASQIAPPHPEESSCSEGISKDGLRVQVALHRPPVRFATLVVARRRQALQDGAGLRRLIFAVLVVLAGAILQLPAAAARVSHPWCMIVQDVSGVWACAFDSFEQCREEARSGNEGFCAPNPAHPPQPHARHGTPR